MTNNDIVRLITRHDLISDQVDERELQVILENLVRTAGRIDGAVVEFGCYVGTTSLYIRRVLDALGDGRAFHVYDSFEGLPEKTAQDSSPAGLQFKAGELKASKKKFVAEFKKAGLRLPAVHKGWFDTLTPADVPDRIAFAFLDGDYYESVKIPLGLIAGRMTPGGMIIVDDYANEALPGAARATDEWAAARNLTVIPVRSLGVIRLPL